MDENLYTGKYTFVEHSSGEYAPDEGSSVKYDNIILSDGIQTAKFKNATGEKKLSFQRGDQVDIDFLLEFGKVAPRLLLKAIR